MKKLFIVIFIFVFCGFFNSIQAKININLWKIYSNNDLNKDSTKIYEEKFDSLKIEISKLKQENKNLNDSIAYYKLPTFDCNTNYFALIKINKYVAICNKNKKNKVFFFGWVNRTLRKVKFTVIK
jgi:sortase (surface protein transpeptidase)